MLKTQYFLFLTVMCCICLMSGKMVVQGQNGSLFMGGMI